MKPTNDLAFARRQSSDLGSGSVSETLVKMLSDQAGREAYNSRFYLRIHNTLSVQGLDKIAAHFRGQYDEECAHAALVIDYLNKRNERAQIVAVDAIDADPQSATDIAQQYVARERATTADWKRIAAAAWGEMDLLTFAFAQEMLDKQVAEEDEAMTFQDQAEATKNDSAMVLLWNLNFAI